jgi:hypothetical protein
MLLLVTLVTRDVSEERNASIIRVTIIGQVGTTLAVTSNRIALRRNAMTDPRPEALIWDTRVRMEEGVGVPGSGVGFGRSVKEPAYSPRAERVFIVNRTVVTDGGPRRRVDLGHVRKVFREPIRGFYNLLRQKSAVVWDVTPCRFCRSDVSEERFASLSG